MERSNGSNGQKEQAGLGATRMWQMVLAFIGLQLIGFYIDPLMAYGILAESIPKLSKAAIACFFFYWVLRLVTHQRTHLVEDVDERANWLAVAYGLVVAASVLT